MKTKTTVLGVFALLALAGCTTSEKLNSAREWQRAECNRIIDNESRLRCLRRVDDDYGRVKEEAEARKR